MSMFISPEDSSKVVNARQFGRAFYGEGGNRDVIGDELSRASRDNDTATDDEIAMAREGFDAAAAIDLAAFQSSPSSSVTAVESRSSVVDYQPGNGSRYVVIVSHLRNLASNDADALGLGMSTEGIAISVVGRGAMVLAPSDKPLSREYVGRKLGYRSGDAHVITELLAAMLGREAID